MFPGSSAFRFFKHVQALITCSVGILSGDLVILMFPMVLSGSFVAAVYVCIPKYKTYTIRV